MRKRVFPRILLFMFLSCLAFVLLAGMQFARQGNFSLKMGGMTINGRYALSGASPAEASAEHDRRLLDGGVSVIFGGMEFRLAIPPDAEGGFTLVDSKGGRQQVFPEYISVKEDEVVFALPGGAELGFAAQNQRDDLPELRISGKFPKGITAMDIPLKPQRSSVVRGSGSEAFTVTYNGSRYRFSRSMQSLEDGRLVLPAGSPSIAYRAISDKKENNPADFIVPGAASAQAYKDAVARWTDRNFEWWNRMPPEYDEDTVIAWCAEALRKGSYRSAVTVIPVGFSNSPGRSWESSVYQFDRRTGVWERAVTAVSVTERERTSLVTRRLAGRDTGLFAEYRLVEFLAVRGYDTLLNNVLVFAKETDPSEIKLAACPGILENCAAVKKWLPNAPNPFEPLAEQACLLAADALRGGGDWAFVFSGGLADTEFNLRLGIALHEWGELYKKGEWAALGRSLAFSVISLDDGEGSVPASLAVDQRGEITAGAGGSSKIGTARLQRLLGGDFQPRAVSTGADNIWAWTAASSVNIIRNDRQMDINVSFPVGETHYLMLRNIDPFPALQIYEMNWRRAYDFESYYDSSGWYYFERERTLVIKIRHRTSVERIRILYVLPTPPPPPPQPEPPAPLSPPPPAEEARPAAEEPQVPHTPPEQRTYQGMYGAY